MSLAPDKNLGDAGFLESRASLADRSRRERSKIDNAGISCYVVKRGEGVVENLSPLVAVHRDVTARQSHLARVVARIVAIVAE